MAMEMFSALRMMSRPPAPEGGVGSSYLEFFVIAVFLPQRFCVDLQLKSLFLLILFY
jgi:hypothetical protein